MNLFLKFWLNQYNFQHAHHLLKRLLDKLPHPGYRHQELVTHASCSSGSYMLPGHGMLGCCVPSGCGCLFSANVWRASVAYFYCVSIYHTVEWVSLREVFVNKQEEFSPNISLII